MRKFALTAAAIGIVSLVAVACGGSSSSTGSAATGASSSNVQKGGTLHFIMQSDYDYWDGTSYYGAMWSWASITSNGLLDYPNTSNVADSSTLIPGVAASLPEISPDGKTYTFTIRQGLVFNNNKPLTPADVLCTFNRNLSPVSAFYGGALGSGYYNVIDGMDKYTAVDKNSKPLASDPKSIPGIKVDGQKVIFTLTEADPAFANAVALRFMTIIPCGTPYKHTALQPPSTGPYMIVSHEVNKSAKIVRNPYWATNSKAGLQDGPGMYNVNEFDWTMGISQDTQFLQIKNNQADYSYAGDAPQGAQVAQAATDPTMKGRFFSSDDAAVSYLFFKVDRAPFDNVKLRQAVNYAINRNALITIGGGTNLGKPWSQILSSNLITSDQPTDLYPNDPNVSMAKQLVQQSGVKTPIPITLTYITSPATTQQMTEVKNDLDAVGFNTTLKGLDGSVYYQFIQDPKSDFSVGQAGWGQDFGDGITFFNPLLASASAGGGSNYGQFKDPSLDASIKQVAAMPIGPDRSAAWAKLSTDTEKNLAPWATFRNRRQPGIISTHYGNYVWLPTQQIYLSLAYYKP